MVMIRLYIRTLDRKKHDQIKYRRLVYLVELLPVNASTINSSHILREDRCR